MIKDGKDVTRDFQREDVSHASGKNHEQNRFGSSQEATPAAEGTCYSSTEPTGDIDHPDSTDRTLEPNSNFPIINVVSPTVQDSGEDIPSQPAWSPLTGVGNEEDDVAEGSNTDDIEGDGHNVRFEVPGVSTELRVAQSTPVCPDDDDDEERAKTSAPLGQDLALNSMDVNAKTLPVIPPSEDVVEKV